MDLRATVIAKTLRVPAVDGPAGDGALVARQLDVALLAVGFTCSRALLDHLAGRHPATVRDTGETVLRAVRELVGDHVRHNAYFIDFPRNVPQTLDFWSDCVAAALMDPRSAGNVAQQLSAGTVNLLDLPIYGRYQHTYEALLAAHDELVLSANDRVTMLQLGGSLARESHALYLSLATRPVPLDEADLALLGELADLHVGDEQPETIQVRESRAVVNRVRLAHGLPLLVDTAVDVLRLACAMSGGDVSLSQPTRFRSFRRAERRALLAALDSVSPTKLPDVNRFAERFKRLGERLHPHEYPRFANAQAVFAVARGERAARSLAGRAELALAAGRPDEAVAVLEHAPGMLLRSVDRLVRAGADVTDAVRRVAPDVSTRVLLSLREHLDNRDAPDAARVFVNQQGRAWVAPDEREPLRDAAALKGVLDEAIAARLPRLEVDPDARTITVPLSEKSRPDGIGVLPRGTTLPVAERARFFIYWKEHSRTTDYDLSVLLLRDDFTLAGQVSFTNLQELGAVHSGDIVEAPAGASEFIDLDLSKVDARYVVPTVNVYSGEGFDAVGEAFFGYMERDADQQGRPFEPRTVRMKSDLFGRGRVMLPVLFARSDAGWQALWMHLNLNGWPQLNRVERNHRSASVLVRAIVERRYLTLAYLESISPRTGPVTRVGLGSNLVELLNPA